MYVRPKLTFVSFFYVYFFCTFPLLTSVYQFIFACQYISGKITFPKNVSIHHNFYPKISWFTHFITNGNVKIYKALIPEMGPILSLSYILRHFKLKFHKRGFFVKNNDFYISDLVFQNFRFLKCHFIFQIFGVSQFWGFKDPQILRN